MFGRIMQITWQNKLFVARPFENAEEYVRFHRVFAKQSIMRLYGLLPFAQDEKSHYTRGMNLLHNPLKRYIGQWKILIKSRLLEC